VGAEASKTLQELNRHSDADEAGRQDHGNRHQPRHEKARSQVEDEDLDADHDEEDRVQELVGELPEGIQVLDRVLRHGQGPTPISDEETRHDHGQGPGDVKSLGQGIPTRHEGEGQENLHLVSIHRPQHPKDHPPHDSSEDESTPHLDCQQVQDLGDGDPPRCRRLVGGRRGSAVPSLSDGHLQNQEKENDPDAIIEEGLPGDLHQERFRHSRLSENGAHRDRIGGGDQGSEEKSIDKGDLQPQRGK